MGRARVSAFPRFGFVVACGAVTRALCNCAGAYVIRAVLRGLRGSVRVRWGFFFFW